MHEVIKIRLPLAPVYSSQDQSERGGLRELRVLATARLATTSLLDKHVGAGELVPHPAESAIDLLVLETVENRFVDEEAEQILPSLY